MARYVTTIPAIYSRDFAIVRFTTLLLSVVRSFDVVNLPEVVVCYGCR